MRSVTTVNMVTLGMLGLAVLIAVGLFFKPASAVLASGPESGTSAQSARVTKSHCDPYSLGGRGREAYSG